MSLFFHICIENVNVCLYLYHRIGLKIHFWIRNPKLILTSLRNFFQNKSYGAQNFFTYHARHEKNSKMSRKLFLDAYLWSLPMKQFRILKNHLLP